MYVVVALYLITVKLLNVLFQLFYFEPHGQVVVTLLFPDVLLLKINDLVLYFVRRYVQFFNCVIDLRNTVYLEVLLLLRNDIAYMFVLST